MNKAKTLSDVKYGGGRRLRDNRPSASMRGYGPRWQRSRLVFLKKNPLCVICRAEGLVVPATVVDHIVPHRGNQELFWDMDNWQSMCKPHHDTKTAKENGGFGNG